MTDHPLVEAVARALCVYDCQNPDSIVDEGRVLWTLYCDEARAAIRAVLEGLREPSEVMMSAGCDAGYDENTGYCSNIWEARGAMLDAARKEILGE